MWIRALTLSLVSVCLAIGAGACGDDEPSDDTAATVEQVEEICTDWKATLDERGDFPVDDFDPENPSPDDLPAVGEYFASGEPAAEEAIAELRALSPPAEIEADVDALVSALDQQLEGAKTQASAAQAGDVAAFTATLDGVGASQEAVKEAADQLGTPSCSF
jgi:hypothetical protein